MVKYKTISSLPYLFLKCFYGAHLSIDLRPYFIVSIITRSAKLSPRAHLATRLMNKIDIAL